MIDLKQSQKIIVKTLAGCESLLEEELLAFGCLGVQKLTRAVMLDGTWDDVYKINYASRFALNVLVNITNFQVQSVEDIYKGARQVFWHQLMGLENTFAIKHAINSPLFNHSQLCALKVKDAIVDSFNERFNQRPSVDKDSPDFIFHIHISNEKCQLLIDTSGKPLYQRGYKVFQGIAPLNEILAAAMVKWLNWDYTKPLIDPFCGSGTLLTEAYLQAIQRPAGYYRKQYAFMKFKGFNRSNWEDVKTQYNKKELYIKDLKITGFEINKKMYDGALKNLDNIGANSHIEMIYGDFFDLYKHQSDSYFLVNPPYGKRLDNHDEDFFRILSQYLKRNCAGTRVGLVAPVPLVKKLGFKPVFKQFVFNGDIECQYVAFELFSGAKS